MPSVSPEGCRTVAGGITPGTPHTMPCTPAGVPDAFASNVFLFKLDHVLCQKAQIFLSKRASAMMRFLILNVTPDGGNVRNTYGENAISILPAKTGVANGVMHPFGGFAFHITHDLGDQMRGFEADQHVDMIGDASDFRGNSASVTNQAAHEGVEPFTPAWSDERNAVFGSENKVVIQSVVCGRHTEIFQHPCRGASRFSGIPGVLPLATVRQPSGLTGGNLTGGNLTGGNLTGGNHIRGIQANDSLAEDSRYSPIKQILKTVAPAPSYHFSNN